MNQRDYNRAYYRANRERLLARAATAYDPDAKREYDRAYKSRPTVRRRDRTRSALRRAKDDGRIKARQLLNNAVAAGRVVRLPCEVCGVAKVQAHHPDYAKPLDVRWLCRRHHDKEHHDSHK